MAARRRSLSFDQALDRMRRGAVLNLEHVRNKPVWTLESRDVAPEVVDLLISRAKIEPAGDSLLDNALSQTWRIPSRFAGMK